MTRVAADGRYLCSTWREKQGNNWAPGLVKESCMKVAADLRGLPGGPCSVGSVGSVSGRGRKWKHTAPSSLTASLHSTYRLAGQLEQGCEHPPGH